MSKAFPRSLLASISWLAIGSLLGQLVSAAAIPALARTYLPSALGVWAIVQSYAMTMSSLAGLRYELAVPVAKDAELAPLVRLQLLVTLLVTVLLCLGLLLWTPRDLGEGSIGLSHPVLLVTCVLLVGGGAVYELAGQICVRNGRFRTLAASRFAYGPGTNLAQLGAGWLLGGQPSALIAGSAVATGVAAAVGCARNLETLTAATRRDAGTNLRAIAWQFRHFPAFVVPYSILTLARDRGLFLALAAFLDLATVGLVSMAQRIAALPAGFAATAVGPVLHRHLASAERPSVYEPFVGRTLLGMIWIGAAGFSALAGLSGWLMPALLGREWSASGPFCSALAISGFTLFLSGVFDRTFDVVRRQATALWLEGSNSICSLTAVILVLWAGSGPVPALVAFSLVNAVHHVLWIVCAWIAIGFSRNGLLRLGLHFAAAVAGGAGLAMVLGIGN